MKVTYRVSDIRHILFFDEFKVPFEKNCTQSSLHNEFKTSVKFLNAFYYGINSF